MSSFIQAGGGIGRCAARSLRSVSRALRRAAPLGGTFFVAQAAFAGVFYPDGTTTLHFAFEGSPNGDRPVVRPPAFFHAEDGFGFVDSPRLVGTAMGVTAPNYFRFDASVPAGTYEVAVTLGGAPEDAIINIKAENHRAVVQDVHLARGQRAVKTFTVIVKPDEPHHAAAGAGSRLTLEFEGTNPSLMKLDIKPSPKPVAEPAK
jgi:hypothetical protein